MTVQVPHTPCSHPTWVPVSPSVFAQDVDEQPARLHGDRVAQAVDGQGDRDQIGHGQAPPARRAATAMASRVKWGASFRRKLADAWMSVGGAVAAAAR